MREFRLSDAIHILRRFRWIKPQQKPLPQLPTKQNEPTQLSQSQMKLPQLNKLKTASNETTNFDTIYSKARDLCFLFSSVIQQRKQQRLETLHLIELTKEQLEENTRFWRESIQLQNEAEQNSELGKNVLSWIGDDVNKHHVNKRKCENDLVQLEKRLVEIDDDLERFNRIILDHLMILNELTIVSMMNNVKQSLYSESIEVQFFGGNENLEDLLTLEENENKQEEAKGGFVKKNFEVKTTQNLNSQQKAPPG